MSKIAGVSLLVLGGLGILYPFVKKGKKLTISDIVSTNEQVGCDILEFNYQKAQSDFITFNKENQQSSASYKQKTPQEKEKLEIQRQKNVDELQLTENKLAKSNCGKLEEKSNCSDIKEQIDALKSDLEIYNEQALKDPKEAKRSGGLLKSNLDNTKEKLAEKEALFTKLNCVLESNFSTELKYKDFKKCTDLDTGINGRADEILKYRKLVLQYPTNNSYKVNLAKWEESLRQYELEFANLNCRDKISQQRLKDTAVISTLASEKIENSILNPNQQEQYIYIGIGAVVLLTGLYIIAKK
jgi:hypothetical protein